ncbi:MAG: hypothetical protein WC374_07610 [Phycisphaerae bacterium]|jgi:hypothetical protein
MQTIRIFGKNYIINRVDGFEDQKQFGNSDPAGVIDVKKNDNIDFENETLLHEIIHCIDESNGIGLNENQVTSLSSGLFCVYRENNMHLIERPGGAE